MARNKAKDDDLFDCSDYNERYYVSRRYDDAEGVMKFLIDKCSSLDIFHSTHMEVYILIKKEMGYPVPVEI